MDKREFRGELKSISPRNLISEPPSEVDEFFLVLALIYNDLKSIIFSGYIREDIYRATEKEEISVHAGEVYGLILFQAKITASTINEFLLFLAKNKSVLNNPLFQRVILRMRKDQLERWHELQNLALDGETPNKSSYVYTLARIRNNIGFHYDHSRKELKRGFAEFFGKEEANDRNTRAYYTLDSEYGTMECTRFYYADAAAVQYITLRAREVDDEGDSLNEFNDYARKMEDTTKAMSGTIAALMDAYLSIKKGVR